MFDNEAYVNLPNDQPTAARLLAIARDNGYDETVVRTSESGYFVPDQMVDLIFPAAPTEEG